MNHMLCRDGYSTVVEPQHLLPSSAKQLEQGDVLCRLLQLLYCLVHLQQQQQQQQQQYWL